MDEEFHRLRHAVEQAQLRAVRGHLHLALTVRGRHIHRRLEDEAQIIEHHPRCVGPGRLVGVEVRLAMPVIRQEFFKPRMEFRKARERIRRDDAARIAAIEHRRHARRRADLPRHFEQLLVDLPGLRLAPREQSVEKSARFLLADRERDQPQQDAAGDALHDGDGDVRPEVARAVVHHFAHMAPELCLVHRVQRRVRKFAEPDEISVEVAHPQHGQLLHPVELLADARNLRQQVVEICEDKRRARTVKRHRILVPVDVVAETGEPLSAERRVVHEPEGIRERLVKAALHKVPCQRRDDVWKTLGGFVARPARRNGGDGARLQEPQLAAGEAPLDVLRKPVVALDAQEQIRELAELRRVEAGQLGLVAAGLDFLRAARDCDDFARLARDVRAADGARFLVEFKLVHLSIAADHGFAEAVVRIDHKFADVAGDGIDAEADARDFARDHALHDHGHFRQRVIESLLLPIGDGAIVPQREEARLDAIQNLRGTRDVQKSVVLPGERRACEILHRR